MGDPDWGRIGAGVLTMGGSELLKAGGDAIGSGLTNKFQAQGLTDEQKAQFLAAVQKAQAEKAAQINPALVGQLTATSQGQGPSVAGHFLQQASDQNIAQQNALAASGRGNVNPGLALRNAQMNAAQTEQGLAGDAARMKEGEALAATGQLAGLSSEQAKMDTQQQQFSDTLAQQYANMGVNAGLNAQQINAGTAAGNQATTQKLIGGAISGLTSAGATAASDERLKKDIHGGDADIYSFLDHLHAKAYKYKNPDSDGHGTEHSVIAQDMEKTPVGRPMVEERPDGMKQIDYGKGFGVILAAQAALHERLKAIEAKRK